MISKVKISPKSFVYDGKAKELNIIIKDDDGVMLAEGTDYTVKYSNNTKAGLATATIKYNIYYKRKGTIKKNFVISPEGTEIKKITAEKKGFKVNWKKQPTQTSGYQIQYSKSSKFKKAKTVTVKKNSIVSAKASKLGSKNTYYVRVRTYKTVNNKKYCSSWSEAKTVKTK